MLRLLLLLFALAGALLGEEPALQPGRVTPRVVCAKDPRFSYALYLPSGYVADRPWPVLLAFAPDGEGVRPVELFQAEAERLGWIVAGSLDSRNGPLEPALAAQRALWEDVHARFRIDTARIVATGFSGGARMALRLALDRPGQVLGVLSFGAFRALGRELPFGQRLHVFLACGDEDFNYLELREARRDLEARGQKAWWDVHPGGHRWPPPEVAARGLGFMAILAARSRPSGADRGLEARWAEGCLAEARERQAGGARLAARRSLEALARLLPDQPAAQAARGEARALARDPACGAEAEAEETADAEARRVMAARTSGTYPALLRGLAAEARAAHGLEARYKAMLLRNEGFVLEDLARANWARQDYKRSALEFETLADLAPERPGPAYFAACAFAQAGDGTRGLAWLRRALERGFRDLGALREDPALDPLRGRPEFQDLLRER